MVWRRRLLAAAVVGGLLVVGVTEARRHWPGDVETGAAAAHGAQILGYDVRSRFAGRRLAQVAAIPRTSAATCASTRARSRRADRRRVAESRYG